MTKTFAKTKLAATKCYNQLHLERWESEKSFLVRIMRNDGVCCGFIWTDRLGALLEYTEGDEEKAAECIADCSKADMKVKYQETLTKDWFEAIKMRALDFILAHLAGTNEHVLEVATR